MIETRDNAHRALKRMLANGPLTAVPKRPGDEALLVQLAASRFQQGRTYTEKEVNEELGRWLGTFCAPFGIDHVTMRRMLVDSRRLTRDKSGSVYGVNAAFGDRLDFEPAAILAEVAAERRARKQEHRS